MDGGQLAAGGEMAEGVEVGECEGSLFCALFSFSLKHPKKVDFMCHYMMVI